MTQTEMTRDQLSAAYAAVKERYGLKAKQRDMLDTSPLYGEIMRAAHEGNLDLAGGLLVDAGIMSA